MGSGVDLSGEFDGRWAAGARMSARPGERRATLHIDTSRPFEKPSSGRIAVKVINHPGDEVLKVFRV